MKRRLVPIAAAFLLLLTACAVPAEEKGAASQGQADSLVSLTQETVKEDTSTELTEFTEKGADTMATQAYPNAAFELMNEWQKDQEFALADPAPTNLAELKAAVDVTDPRSVAAYWVLAVNRLTENYDDGMAMMKYLFADIEPFGRGYTEGGGAGRAGWDTYFNERLKDSNYSWLPRAYFNGTSDRSDKFALCPPLSIDLYYNEPNTKTCNDQSLEPLGRLNIVYWVKSRAAGNQVNITLSRFEGTDRWYVTSGASSAALFYMQ